MVEFTPRDLMQQIGTEMNKEPQEIERWVEILDENEIDTIDVLRETTKEELKDIGFKLGTIKKIIQRLAT